MTLPSRSPRLQFGHDGRNLLRAGTTPTIERAVAWYFDGAQAKAANASVVPRLQDVDRDWKALMAAYDAGSRQIALALQPALSHDIHLSNDAKQLLAKLKTAFGHARDVAIELELELAEVSAETGAAILALAGGDIAHYYFAASSKDRIAKLETGSKAQPLNGDAALNETLKQEIRNVREAIAMISTLTGKDDAEIAAVFAAVANHQAALAPKAAQLKQSIALVHIPGAPRMAEHQDHDSDKPPHEVDWPRIEEELFQKKEFANVGCMAKAKRAIDLLAAVTSENGVQSFVCHV